MEDEVGGAERIGDVHRERRALRQVELERVERHREHRRLRPRPLAAVAPRDPSELGAQALLRLPAGAREQRLHRGRDGRIGDRGRVEDEGTIVRIPISVHVAGDDGRVRITGAERARPVHAHGVEEVIADVVADLVARVEGTAGPLHEQRVAGGVLEAAHLLAIVRVDVRGAPRKARAEARRRDAERDLTAHAVQVGDLLRDARERRRQSVVARSDRAVEGHDARRLHIDRTSVLGRQREPLHAAEVQVHTARLVLVERVRHLERRREAVVEHGTVPLHIGAEGALRLIVAREERDVRRRVGEDRATGAVGAEHRDLRGIETVRRPVGDGRGGTDTGDALHAGGETGVVERATGELRARRVLEDTHSATDHGARTANRALEARDLRGLAIGPREAHPRAHEHLIRQDIIAHAKGRLDRRVEVGPVDELIGIDAHAILHLEVRIDAPRVTERGAGDPLTRVADARDERARERRRNTVPEIRERVEPEGAEIVRVLLRRVAVEPDLAGELQAVAVVLAEPGEEVVEREVARGVDGVEVRIAAERDVAHAIGAVGEGRVHEHRTAGEREIGIGVVARDAEAEVGLAEEDPHEAGVLELGAAAGVGALAGIGGHGIREARRGVLLGDVSVEREIERLPRERRRRREVEGAEDEELVVVAIVRDAADAHRHVRGLQDAQEPGDGVLRDA